MSPDADNVEFTEHESGAEFSVKVVPGSSRDKIVGVWEKALRIAVAAPPEGGKANQSLVRLLANTFGIKRGAVEITQGRTRPLKRVRVSGLTVRSARQVLAAVLGSDT